MTQRPLPFTDGHDDPAERALATRAPRRGRAAPPAKSSVAR